LKSGHGIPNPEIFYILLIEFLRVLIIAFSLTCFISQKLLIFLVTPDTSYISGSTPPSLAKLIYLF
jgi:hypothetical protein